ncbi:MAG: hypothetical protein QW666_00450 [Candidatus Woesearchaeota archaeon]
MKKEKIKAMILLGIIALFVIIGLVMLFNSALTGEYIRAYPPAAEPVKFPTSFARMYCTLPEPRLDLTQYECRMIGWAQCAQLHGTPGRITTCQEHCGQEIANICRKAYGNYGIGIQYTYEPHLGLRRPVTDN